MNVVKQVLFEEMDYHGDERRPYDVHDWYGEKRILCLFLSRFHSHEWLHTQFCIQA